LAAPPKAAWGEWKEYDASDVAARENFFEVSTDDVAYVSTLDGHLKKGESLLFWVRRNIVNRVISNLLFVEDSRLRTALQKGTGL
jgi:hypothetical protein